MAFPRILIAGLRGGSGKTIVSLGLIASLRKRGMAVAPFKKGPDFIDAEWLALAAGRLCHNLDTFMMSPEKIRLSFSTFSISSDISVIEGNRGLYDGMDVDGSVSTAELAKLLKAPVILVIDCTKSTRTVAALVLGCMHFDSDVRLAGVVLNRVAGPRHEAILRESISAYCSIPVLGAIPKLKKNAFPERHMGLVPTPEHAWASDSIDQAVVIAEQYLDLDRILAIAKQAKSPSEPPFDQAPSREEGGVDFLFSEKTSSSSHHARGGGRRVALESPQDLPDSTGDSLPPRIGVVRDGAFQFYYPENVQALEAAGAEVVFLSALEDSRLPQVHGIYIGGGFPETHAGLLAGNESFRKDILRSAKNGMPIYAECGGLMYLGESLVLKGKKYPMAGVFPAIYGVSKRPQGHGYSVFKVEKKTPFFDVGTEVRGHEFHYSHVLEWSRGQEDLAFRMIRGGGIDGHKDGLFYKNTLATYTHLHALGTPSWAKAMVRAACAYQKSVKRE